MSQLATTLGINPAIDSLTGNVGGVVGPDGVGNITITGTNPMTVTGTPATNSLAITVATATEVQIGVLYLATDAEAIAGTNSADAIVPTSLKAKLGPQTLHGVLIGEATTAAFGATAAGTAGQLLTSGGAAADPLWTTATYPATVGVGEFAYGSAANTYTNLAFVNTATRYLANTGGGATIPAWAQVDLFNGVTGILSVVNGGTGANTLTIHGVLVGNTLGVVNATMAGTTGQLLVAETGADPAFASSADGNFAFTSTTATVQRTLTVSNTNNTAVESPANLQVTVGGATNTGDPFVNFLVTGAGTYSVGIDNTVANDPFKITSGAKPSAGTDLFTMTNTGVITLNNDLDVTEGGTGVSTLTSHGILMGNGAGDIQATAEPSDGQILIGKTGDFPQLATITAGTGVGITNAAGSITVNAVGGGLTWAVTTIDAPLVVNNGYIANKAGLLTMTLPATAAIGDVIAITGINTAVGWRIAQNANQRIHFGNVSTTVGVGGYLEATAIRDSVQLICVVAGASTEWNIINSVGNITVV